MVKFITPCRSAILLSCCFVLIACSQQPTGTPTATLSPTPNATASETHPPYRPGTWIHRTPYQWGHDGLPYESEHFIVYSDSARMEEKSRFADEAEKFYKFILDFLEITEDQLRFPSDRGKIEIFGSTKHSLELGGGYAYYGGFLFTYDQGEYRMGALQWPDSFLFGSLFTHEITHEIAFLLLGSRSIDGLLVATWFDEGLAVLISQDDPYHISSLAQYKNLVQSLEAIPGQGNPILIEKWEQIPHQYFSDEMMNKLYAVFELATRYLADTHGAEKFKYIYLDVREGSTFEEAFLQQYGFTLEEFQITFYSRMEGYLP